MDQIGSSFDSNVQFCCVAFWAGVLSVELIFHPFSWDVLSIFGDDLVLV